jgi:YidC/Oxa1 family membrane protein insertase
MLLILQFFHALVGNWGVAIIMLTVMVRLLMFPLSRKQALAAVKMQALKPELDALREKYKSDKEKLSRAQMELWRKHKVNPLGGCLPLVIQMPIFIGLWQALQSSVDLRQARFLWIDNLAAPDGPSVKFFHWGENIPLISWAFGPYFNLLPAILIGLFLIQQKLFMPPKSANADPQTEMQQKMMTYMLVFFGYIFWRLPSGLCLYYIASTLWGIAERKLLPKLPAMHYPDLLSDADKKSDEGDERKTRGSDRDGRGNGRDARDRPKAERRTPTFIDRLQELLKKADKRQ